MTKKIITILVSLENQGLRLDIFLNTKVKDLSRTKLQDLIKEGFVKINQIKIKECSKKLNFKDNIEVEIPPQKKSHIKPYKMNLDILYNDEDIILINKAPGVVVHPGAGNYDKTLVNGLMYHYKNLSSVGGKLRPGIVHRIDKDTSGVIVIAKNDKAHNKIAKQFSSHSIKRKYEALIWGALRPQNGKINKKISRSKNNRQLMTTTIMRGKEAITNYKTIKIFKNKNIPTVSLIECQLETGRTHQIRVHMTFKGNPILGDKSYGKKKRSFKNIDSKIKENITNFNRQALHAKSLGFLHPSTGNLVYFEAPRPNDFDKLIKNLKKASI